MLDLHRDKKSEGVDQGGSIVSHRQDGNVEAHRLMSEMKKKRKKKYYGDKSLNPNTVFLPSVSDRF